MATISYVPPGHRQVVREVLRVGGKVELSAEETKSLRVYTYRPSSRIGES